MARNEQSWVVPFLFVPLCLLLAARGAAADPVPITSGFLTINWDGCCAGFSMSGEGFSIGVADNLHVSHSIGTLAAGTTAEADFTYRGGGRGGATIDGERVRNPDDPLGFGFIYFAGDLFFDTDPFLVADTDPTAMFAEFSTTFRMTGHLSGYSTFDRTGDPLFSVALSGQGTSTINLLRRFETAEGVVFAAFGANQIFRFEPAQEAPVPEPASLLLLGSGLAGLALRRKARQT